MNNNPVFIGKHSFSQSILFKTSSSRHVAQLLSHCLWHLHSTSGYQFTSWLFHFLSSFSLVILGSNGWWLKFLSPCHSHGRPRWNSWLLVLTWSNSNRCTSWGGNEQMKNLFSLVLFFCFVFSFFFLSPCLSFYLKWFQLKSSYAVSISYSMHQRTFLFHF